MYELNTCHNITISYFNEYLHTRQEHQPSILGAKNASERWNSLTSRSSMLLSTSGGVVLARVRVSGTHFEHQF